MYKLTNGTIVLKTLPGICIPIQPVGILNSDWDKYQEWLKEGNKPLPADLTSPYDSQRDLAAEIDTLKLQVASHETTIKALEAK